MQFRIAGPLANQQHSDAAEPPRNMVFSRLRKASSAMTSTAQIDPTKGEQTFTGRHQHAYERIEVGPKKGAACLDMVEDRVLSRTVGVLGVFVLFVFIFGS